MGDLFARMDTDDIFTPEMYSHYAEIYAEHADDLSTEVRGALEMGSAGQRSARDGGDSGAGLQPCIRLTGVCAASIWR